MPADCGWSANGRAGVIVCPDKTIVLVRHGATAMETSVGCPGG